MTQDEDGGGDGCCGPPTLGKYISSTQARIIEQERLMALLQPGSEEHKLASRVLFALQDTLFALSEAERAIEQP